MKEKLNYVTTVITTRIYLYCGDRRQRSAIKKLGARRDWVLWKTWYIRYQDDDELATIFMKLRDLGILFALGGPPGWNPADDFILLREQNKVTGKFTAITWTGPGKYHKKVL